MSSNTQPFTVLEPEMIHIPEGSFLMGCDQGAECEKPIHRVWIDTFAVARFAITNRQYQAFLDERSAPDAPHAHIKGVPQTGAAAGRSTGLSRAFSDDIDFNQPDQPVTSVGWFDAIEYCEWLAARTQKPYRLPTEAEWERAARGGLEGMLYTWGNEPPENQPGYFDLWKNGPERVGQRPPNGFGLYDISENVHEWCSDWFDVNYYSASPERNPQGPEQGTRRASRGGSWRHKNKITRVAARSSIPPEFRYSDYGFRPARGL